MPRPSRVIRGTLRSFGTILIMFGFIFGTFHYTPSIEGQSDDHDLGPPWYRGQPDPCFNSNYRVLVEVETLPFPMVNYPVELEINFTDLVDEQDFEPELRSINIIEYSGNTHRSTPLVWGDGNNSFGKYSVPYRYYADHDFNMSNNAKGVLTWILAGDTKDTRYFHIYFSSHSQCKQIVKWPDYGNTTAPIDSLYWIHRGTIFYGFNPGMQHDWENADEIEVVGLYDSTDIEIFDITDRDTPKHLYSQHIDRGELLREKVPDGTYFKIVAQKPVVASVSSALNEAGSAKTFYPSSDRNMVGNDFLIAPYYATNWNDHTYGLNVYAMDDTKVLVSATNGNLLKEFDLGKFEYSGLRVPEEDKVIHVSSTGPIAIEQKGINAFTSVPSITGSPIGKRFFGSIQPFDGDGIHIFAFEGSNVTVRDLSTNEVVASFDLQKGEEKSRYGLLGSDSKDMVLSIESTGNISTLIGSSEGGTTQEHMGDDISFSGGYGGHDLMTRSIGNPGPGKKDDQYPTDPYPGILFSFSPDTRVEVNGTPYVLDEDQWMGLPVGVQRIEADRPVSVMSLGRGHLGPSEHRWNDWGSYLSGRLTNPKVHIGPVQTYGVDLDIRPHPDEGTLDDTMVHAVEPGATTIFKMVIENRGDLPEYIPIDIGDPIAGWSMELDTMSVSLEPGQTEPLNLRVQVPPDAKSEERFEIPVKVQSYWDLKVNDSVLAVVIVDPVHFPDLEGENLRYVDPGKTVVFPISMTNLGNGPDEMTLTLKGLLPKGWTAVLSRSSSELDMFENINLTLNVTASKDALADFELVLDIVATSKGDPTRVDVLRTRTIVNQVYDFQVSIPNILNIYPDESLQGNSSLTIENLGNGIDGFRILIPNSTKGWKFDHRALVNVDHHDLTNIKITLIIPGWDEVQGKWSDGPSVQNVTMTIENDVGMVKEVNLTVRVHQFYSIDLSSDQREVLVAAGERANFRLKVLNLGNGEDNISMRVDPKAKLDKDSFTLLSGEKGYVALTIPPRMDSQREVVYLIEANSTNGNGSSLFLSVRYIQPRNSQSLSDYSCLWVVLVALSIFISIQVIRIMRKNKVF